MAQELTLSNVCEGNIDAEFQRCYKEALAAGGGKITINLDVTTVEGTSTMAKIKAGVKCALPGLSKAAVYQFDNKFTIEVDEPEEEAIDYSATEAPKRENVIKLEVNS
jgi:hypothetical protein